MPGGRRSGGRVGRMEVRVGTMNAGSMTGEGEEL